MSVKTLNFSGYKWIVKKRNRPYGPGPNYFSDSDNNVWIDPKGKLHLKIKKIRGEWHCAEVYLKKSLGYGRYTFYLDDSVEKIDKNVILGLFVYLNLKNEIDIEFSKWGKNNNVNAQFAVQPFIKKGNLKRFNVDKKINYTVNSFLWQKDSIFFESFNKDNKKVIASWIYKGRNIPKENKERARMNLWLLNGEGPSNFNEVEVVISKFSFKKADFFIE